MFDRVHDKSRKIFSYELHIQFHGYSPFSPGTRRMKKPLFCGVKGIIFSDFTIFCMPKAKYEIWVKVQPSIQGCIHVAPKFSDTLISTRGGRFCPPLVRSHLNFSSGYVHASNMYVHLLSLYSRVLKLNNCS
jgi:hypothetical protein